MSQKVNGFGCYLYQVVDEGGWLQPVPCVTGDLSGVRPPVVYEGPEEVQLVTLTHDHLGQLTEQVFSRHGLRITGMHTTDGAVKRRKFVLSRPARKD